MLAAVVLALGAALAFAGDETEVLLLLGYGLAVLALGCLGYLIVASAPGWLRLVVVVALPVLAGMVWALVVPVLSWGVQLSLAAVLMLAVGLPALLGGRRAEPGPEPAGSHRR